MKRKILILGAGPIQLPIIRKASAMGLETIAADYNPNAVGRKYADTFLEVSTENRETLLEAAKKYRIDGILTTSDYPVNIVSYVGEQLGLSAMSTEVAAICTDKYRQRSRWRESGIKTPFFKCCTSDENLEKYNSFPYIVKPCDSSASRGVRKVGYREGLEEAFKEALQYSRSGRVLIESFIEGREFSVETLSQGGITTVINITEKLTKGEKEGYFVEDTHIEPARITPSEWKAISDEVLAATAAIGFDNCPSHTEVKLNAEGAWVIESACRLGGDYITSDLVPLSTGVDMLDNLIKLSLGEKIDVERKFSKFSAVQFINQENYLICKDFIESGGECGEGCRLIRSEIEPRHDRVIKSSLDRMGYLIFQADTMEALEKVLNKLSR